MPLAACCTSMSGTPDSEDVNEKEMSTKSLRKKYASGWMELTKNRSMPFIIDGLLDFSPEKEFNKSELARKSGVSRESVRKYTSLLLDLNIIEEVPDTTEPRYRLNDKGTVTKKLFELNGAVGAVRAQSPSGSPNPQTSTVNSSQSSIGKRLSTSVSHKRIKNVGKLIAERSKSDA